MVPGVMLQRCQTVKRRALPPQYRQAALTRMEWLIRNYYTAMRDLNSKVPVVSIVDDDESVRDALKGFIRSIGFRAETFPSAEDFLASDIFAETACMIVDVHMPVMTGLELQCRLASSGFRIPMIFITARDDPAARFQALKAGAVD